jgi:copper chaperone CopZ
MIAWNVNASSKTFSYEADVEGMVCAFCAYSVSKKIASLPGVDAESVDVDLKNGHVSFRSEQPVSKATLVEVFKASGFSLAGLRETGLPAAGKPAGKRPLVLDMRLNTLDTAQFEPVFEAIGNIAADYPSRLVIEAPEALEGEVLKPVLMGRQQVMKVRFMPADTGSIHLQLYLQ